MNMWWRLIIFPVLPAHKNISAASQNKLHFYIQSKSSKWAQNYDGRHIDAFDDPYVANCQWKMLFTAVTFQANNIPRSFLMFYKNSRFTFYKTFLRVKKCEGFF